MPPKIEVDLIVFDLDGTLADSLPDITRAANFAARSLDLPPRTPEEVKAMIGGGERQLIQRLVGPENQDKVDQALETYLDYYFAHSADHTQIYPEVEATLARLQSKKLAVLTNKMQRLCEQVLKTLGLSRYFAIIQGGRPDLPLKPSPEPLRYLIQEAGAAPDRTLMVGDKPGDIEAGKISGTATAAVTYGYGTPEALKKAAPDIWLASLLELPDRVR